jgi:hypothetical protein
VNSRHGGGGGLGRKTEPIVPPKHFMIK